MSVFMPDRQAEPAGGFLVPSEASQGNREALLALSDGSVWRGRSVGSPGAATGDVRLVGRLVAVGEAGLLSGLDLTSFQGHLRSLHHAGEIAAPRGCITAAGATIPLHAAVALAVARGEIGRP
ncbi:MAG: hypothetical protein ABSG37_05080 [Candidatus Limnocylindrales bacterium]|jgi:hypothetical protein